MKIRKINTTLTALFPAAFSGILLSSAFPKPELHFFAFIALVPLLILIESGPAKQNFFSGLVFGLAHFLSLIYWIVPTVHQYGGLPLPAAVSTLILLSGYLALYPALFCAGYTWFLKGRKWMPVSAAAFWTLLELIRTYLFSGFPWGVLGYSQESSLRLIQIADLFGVYGVSFLVVLVNASIAQTWLRWRKKDPIFFGSLILAVLLVGTAVIYGDVRIKKINDTIAASGNFTVGVIQGNIRQSEKWDAAFKTATVEKYLRLTGTVLPGSPELVIWPETALPFYYGYDRDNTQKVDAFIRAAGTSFLIGSPAFERVDEIPVFYNRAYMIDRFSVTGATYDKHHLVPFGEYVPMGRYLTFLGKLTAQAGNFSPGREAVQPLAFGKNTTGVLICFEILFPEISASFVKNGADLLTTITNDAWFGRTAAPRQHFSFSVFRAVENRRSVVRCANTGISGMIDPTGKISETTALFTDAALLLQVPKSSGISFYTAYGSLAVPLVLFAICLVFMLKEAAKRFGNNRQGRSK